MNINNGRCSAPSVPPQKVMGGENNHIAKLLEPHYKVKMHLFCFFRGGAELLFNGVKEHHVTLPSQSEPCEYHFSLR